MSSSIRLAFVGVVESVSPWLLRAIGQSGGQFVAICDPDAVRAERAAAEFHVRWPYHELRTLLAEAQPHGVVVASALPQRDEVVRRCLAAGVPVLAMGMPVLPSGRMSVRGNAFVWAASAARFSPAGALLRRLIESGKLGGLLSVAVSIARQRATRSVEESAWPVSPDLIFEATDWIAFLAGPIRDVFARGHPDGSVAATLVSKDDVPISLALHEHGPPEAAGLATELRGVDGTLVTLDRHMQLRATSGTRVIASHSPSLGASDPATEMGYAGLMQEFMRRVAEAPRGAEQADWLGAQRAAQAVLSGLTRAGAVKLERRESATAGP